jgi:hypothetical protein
MARQHCPRASYHDAATGAGEDQVVLVAAGWELSTDGRDDFDLARTSRRPGVARSLKQVSAQVGG